MKIQLTQSHKLLKDKAFRRVKLSTMALLVFGGVTFMANNMSEKMNSYISFVDAQEELIIEQFPEVDLNEQGKMAMADFQAWYGLEDFESLDEEYLSVKNMINLKETKTPEPEPETPKCNDDTSELAADGVLKWNGYNNYRCKSTFYQANGFVEEYYGDEFNQCFSGSIVIPGMQLLSTKFLACVWFVFLMYLFLGIAIIADIFMEAIEAITSTTSRKEVWDKTGKNKFFVEVPVWNATIANLSLMALGSSAPEILLNVLETWKLTVTQGKAAGALGPSTIVGSAAFNLLFISAVCIPAVDEPKKIFDMGVFCTTAFFSLFAYLWLYSCLSITTPGEVTLSEAWMTLGFFMILLILAFCADKINQMKVDKAKNEDERRADELKVERDVKKTQLRQHAKKYGDLIIIEVAHNIAGTKVDKPTSLEIRELLMSLLDTEDLKEATAHEIHNELQPDTLFERFAARKAVGAGQQKDFLSIKGTAQQLGDEYAGRVNVNNGPEHPQVHFKCLHYSVTESSGQVDVCVQKVTKGSQFSFGIRTVEDTAKRQSEYEHIDRIIDFNANQNEIIVPIRIIDNSDWQPDLEFIVELYDATDSSRTEYEEYDTKTRVTILDEDFPGTLGFENTSLVVSKNQTTLDLVINRTNGSDGKINCTVRTQTPDGTSGLQASMAQEFVDYYPCNEKVVFAHGETSQTVKVKIVNQQIEKIKQFLVETKRFEWIDPNNKKNGHVIFGGDGVLSSPLGHGTWELIDHRNILINFAKFGDMTMALANEGQEWNAVAPHKSAQPKLVSSNENIKLDMSEPEEQGELLLKIAIERPEPQGVKMSRKNVALVTITSEDQEDDANENAQLLEFFMSEQKPGWGQQFRKAIMLGPQVEDSMIIDHVTLTEAVAHFITITWKLLFAFVPPTHWGGGWPAFLVALTFIGLVTFIVGEVAGLLGCTLGMPDSVTAITLVALGTSLPDTFASMTAARSSEYADSAVGNVTGSNSVNVFLGLGLPWVFAAYAQEARGKPYLTPAGDLAYSVTVFLICSVICFIVLAVRRVVIGGELGGPKNTAYASSAFLISLWVIYIVLSILKATAKTPEAVPA